jgi:hypothetical protein
LADQLFQIIDNDGSVPKTPRIISVSGCLLPIETAYSTVSQQVLLGYEKIETPWYIPEKTIVIPEQLRPIMTDSSKYCPEGGCRGDDPAKEIQDGPIIVAEEFENFSPFNNGEKRSRIVVVSDSTIIQGKNYYYRSDIDSANQKFIRSLYPDSPQVDSAGRKFEFTQKILAPERGSPAKYFASANSNLLVPNLLVRKFGLNGVNANLSNYTDQENNFDPRTLSRSVNPLTDEDINREIKYFMTNIVPIYGTFPRFSGQLAGTTYVDAGIGGGIPKIMIDTGADHINFEAYVSGYCGDLFGYSIGIHNDKLIVGAPFNAFDTEKTLTWNDIKSSGYLLKTAGNGGAGAVFYYERTGKGKNAISDTLPWQFQQKIKPSSINAGIDAASTNDLIANMGIGVQNLDSDFIFNNSLVGDQFGYDVAIDADFMVVGAPGHDFETVHQHIYSGSAAFIRKEFTYAFDIPLHKSYDMGSSGVRINKFGNNSGVAVLNNGAVFAFEHRIQDWRTREKKWKFAEKLVSQGYKDRNKGILTGCENDFFGRSVDIDRARRGDGDYTTIVGSPNHDFPTSGTHITGTLNNAGAAYIYDAMLREQEPKIPSQNNWIEASVFGNSGIKHKNKIYQNITGDSLLYSTSGIVYTNQNGVLFLEGSGYDPAEKGFIAHRPYVESIIGYAIDGIDTSGNLTLFTHGEPSKNSGELKLSITGPDSAIVYNNMNLHTIAWNSIESSGLQLFSSGTIPVSNTGILIIAISGASVESEGGLNLRVRGV